MDDSSKQCSPESATFVHDPSTVSSTSTAESPGVTKSILKKNTKYTKTLVEQAAALSADAVYTETPNQESETETCRKTSSTVQDSIVERKVRRRNTKPNSASPQHSTGAFNSIEGFVPGAVSQLPYNNEIRKIQTPDVSNSETVVSETDSTRSHQERKGDEDDETDLVFNSLTDLMGKAGTLPDEKVVSFDKEGTVIEADLSFSVMSPEEFEATMNDQEEGKTQEDVSNPAAEGEDDTEDDDESEKENSQDGEGNLWDLMDDDGMDDEPVYTREERAFLQLWKALSQWVTPDAVEYVIRHQQSKTDELKGGPTPRDWSDVESTRCAGLMSLLQLYLNPVLQNDLQQALEERRKIEQRLGDLIRLFEYTQPSPKLNASNARALTCILIQTVFPEYYQHPTIPPSCRTIGLNADEHRYLVQSAISNFKTPEQDG